MNDELDDLVKALREEHADDCTQDHAFARARLERAFSQRPKYRKRVGVPVLLAACFVGAIAWAQATGQLTRFVESRSVEPSIPSALPAARASRVAPARATEEDAHVASSEGAADVADTTEVADAGTMPQDAPRKETSPRPATRAPTLSPSREEKADAPPPQESPNLDALYHAAHEAHFAKKDPTLALAAWDAYLAAAGPSGRFSLEARYYRAISLIRLGRSAEARTALESFARGEYGEYRRDDARRLLESLP